MDNKQTKVRDANNNVVGTYFYDGEGHRGRKVTQTETIVYVYSTGRQIAEYSTGAPPPANPTTNYTATDPAACRNTVRSGSPDRPAAN